MKNSLKLLAQTFKSLRGTHDIGATTLHPTEYATTTLESENMKKPKLKH